MKQVSSQMMTMICRRLAVSETMKMSNQPDKWRKFRMDWISSGRADPYSQGLPCYHDGMDANGFSFKHIFQVFIRIRGFGKDRFRGVLLAGRHGISDELFALVHK
jgi:hypothetical protein